MKVSVIVPVYNCADYVERCVRSIMAQTHRDLEIICVNDGSSDGSGAILDRLALEDARVRVIHQKNAGVSAARNAGVLAATGAFLTFVDSDDAIEADMYETLLALFTDDDISIAHCGYKRISPDGSVKEVTGTGRLTIQTAEEAAACLLLGRLFVGSLCNKMYRADLFTQIRSDTTLAINEDVLVNAEAFSRAKKAAFLDVTKYLMYERPGSATTGTKQEKKLLDCIRAAEKMLQVYRNTPVEPAAAERLYLTLVQAYRWSVLSDAGFDREMRKQFAAKIASVAPLRRGGSARNTCNYLFMRFLPSVYKLVYTLYDRIRTPNWDV